MGFATLQVSGAGVALSDITVTASPFSWSNTNDYPVEVVVSGGTVTLIEFSRGGSALINIGILGGVVRLAPADRIRVTYVVAPTMTQIPH
jgi:hypothetical protein